MKEKIVSFLGIVTVIILAVISVKHFRSETSLPFMNNEAEEILRMEEDEEILIQDGEPDEISEKMANEIKTQITREWKSYRNVDVGDEVIKPEQIVSVGKEIRKEELSYKVDSWKIVKDNPGYLRNDEMIPKEWLGLEMDENGNIMNDFSYVVVNIEVKNLSKILVTDYVWSAFKLRSLGVDFGNRRVTDSVLYLGEDIPREYTKNYNVETIQPNEKVEMPLVFIIQDEFLENKQLYLEINQKSYMDLHSLRWIILN